MEDQTHEGAAAFFLIFPYKIYLILTIVIL